jgi:uncharacterized coiled-coil protein SlyX
LLRFYEYEAEKERIQNMKTTNPSTRNSISRSPLRRGLVLPTLALACFGLSLAPNAFGVIPKPDGGYPNQNTAEGDNALLSLTTGFGNTANGYQTLFRNTTGSDNTGDGFEALASNTAGHDNTANGFEALFSNTTGNYNTANGSQALFRNTTGGGNIALGIAAGVNLTTGSNNIDIGSFGVAGESDTIRIGIAGTQTATFIAGIHGATVAGGAAVYVDSSGHLGTLTSSERFKDGIKPMGKASEAILALKPVSFRYNHHVDPKGIPQFGLVAEEVEKVNPALVVRDADGKPYTVRYEAVNAMLLNEFLEEHRKVQELKSAAAKQEATIAQQDRKIQEQEATITQLAKGMKTVVARLEEQASQIQKVSARLEASKPTTQVVANNQ